MRKMSKIELNSFDPSTPAAVVFMDHNYSQILPIRAFKFTNPSKEAALDTPALPPRGPTPPKRVRSKSYSYERVSDNGETLEEHELLEYYTQWCDREYDSNRFVKNNCSPGTSLLNKQFKVPYSYVGKNSDPRNTPSTSRDTAVSESFSNLNLLAECGSKELVQDPDDPDGELMNKALNSESDNFVDVKFNSPKPESDYQVLAAANALLQLSSPQDQSGSNSAIIPPGRKRRFTHTNVYEENRRENQMQINQMKMEEFGNGNSWSSFSSASSSTRHINAANKKRKKKRKSKLDTSADSESLEGDLSQFQIKAEPCTLREAGNDPWGKCLPIKVLTNIFQHLAQSQGHAGMIRSVSRVSRLWYTAASAPPSWLQVDLSGVGDDDGANRYLQWLCRHRLSQARTLDLSGWEHMTGKDLQLVGLHCTMLERLVLSGCSKLTSGALRGVIESCSRLQHLDLSATSTSLSSRYFLDFLVENRGQQLLSLNLSYNTLVKFDSILQSMMVKCCGLRLLDLSHAVFSNTSTALVLPLEELQNGCPYLQWFYLNNAFFKLEKPDDEVESAGFSMLETLRIGRISAGKVTRHKYITDRVLHRFLKGSPQLLELDISGCRHLSCAALLKLPCENLGRLFVGHCPMVSKDAFSGVLHKWKLSLNTLDLTSNAVSPSVLRSFIDENTTLSCLTLTGCHGLPWHVRQEYRGIYSLRGLVGSLVVSPGPGTNGRASGEANGRASNQINSKPSVEATSSTCREEAGTANGRIKREASGGRADVSPSKPGTKKVETAEADNSTAAAVNETAEPDSTTAEDDS